MLFFFHNTERDFKMHLSSVSSLLIVNVLLAASSVWQVLDLR